MSDSRAADPSLHVVHTDRAPAAIGPYSQAIRSGELVFTSGQVALCPKSGEMLGGGEVRAEARVVMSNLAAVCEAAGGSLKSILRCTVYLVDMADFQKVNEVYAEAFAGHAPARACVAVAGLPKGARVEIDAVLRVP